MMHSIWMEVELADRYMKFFLKNGHLEGVELTINEYFVLQFLSSTGRKFSFYEIRKLIPMESKQLHLIIKKLVDKGYLKRNYYNYSSEIWITEYSKKIVDEISKTHYELLKNKLSDQKVNDLMILLKELNDQWRIILDRSPINYKSPLKRS